MIRLVMTISDSFSEHLGALLASIRKNNKHQQIECYVVSDYLSLRNQQMIKNVVGSYCSVIFKIENDLRKLNFKVDKHANISNYFRIYLPSLLPSIVSKVIYLDVDTLVLSDLGKLWETDIQNFAIAAVSSPNREREQILGIPPNHYFNSGVMLINLDYWRKNNITYLLSNFLSENENLIKFWDQDALSKILLNRVKFIDEAWNYRGEYHKTKSINILHFAGMHKPWSIHVKNNNTRLYFKYLLKTPYRNVFRLLRSYDYFAF